MKEKMKLCCHVAMMKQEKNRGVNKRSALCFSRPHDRKSIFLSCGLFAFGKKWKIHFPIPKNVQGPEYSKSRR